MANMLKIISKIAKMAGAIQLAELKRVRTIEYKGAINLVTDVDKKCEELIVSEIQKNFPGDDVFAEEGGGKRVASGRRWIIDPLDGTTNYAHGFPFFAVSIGLECEGELCAGIIYDPNRDELFTAEKGKGATLNGERIHVSQSKNVKQSLLATGFACLQYEAPGGINNLGHFANFIKRARAVRRPGSAATDLAWLACGRIDGFWESYLKPWDLAAGVCIIREAGGTVTSFDGSPFDLYGTEVLASNGCIHDEMVKVLMERIE